MHVTYARPNHITVVIQIRSQRDGAANKGSRSGRPGENSYRLNPLLLLYRTACVCTEIRSQPDRSIGARMPCNDGWMDGRPPRAGHAPLSSQSPWIDLNAAGCAEGLSKPRPAYLGRRPMSMHATCMHACHCIALAARGGLNAPSSGKMLGRHLAECASSVHGSA